MPAWSDRLIPDVLRDDAGALSRARLLVRLSGVLCAVGAVYALLYAAIGFRSGAIIVASGAATVPGALLVLWRYPRLNVAGHVLTAVLYAVLVGLVCREGGLTAIATPWLVTPPLFAILLQGRRGAFAWTATSVLTVLALGLADSLGVRFPVDYPAAWAARLQIATQVGLVVATAILIFVFEDVRAAAQARAEAASTELARLAYHDALTGLANRARFLESLDAALARAAADGDPARVAVLLVDLDGFKAVNDMMGHAAGDALLGQVAARLLNATRGSDTVARLGGDEFAVLLENVRHETDVTVVAERIVAAIAGPFALARGEARVGASIGFTRRAAGAGAAAGAAALLHDADVAMYRAKALGKGRWVRHDPGPATSSPLTAA